MITIAIANQKGGVGKTTTALSVGAGILLKGYTMLYADMDMQANLTDTIGGDDSGRYPGTMQVMEQRIKPEKAIQKVGSYSLMGASPSLASADMVLKQARKQYRLKEALRGISEIFQYCVIDTPPTLGIATINALTAADIVIVPCKADYYSLKGLSQLHSTIQTVRKYSNPSLRVGGILITEHDSRSIISRDMAQMLQQTASLMGTKVYETKIRRCSAIRQAQAMKQSIFEYSPRSNAAVDYKKLVEEILSNG